MVGIDGEEEFQAERLKNNSFEARRARNVQNLGSSALNEDKDSLQNANRQIINNRTSEQRTPTSNARPSPEKATQTRSAQRNTSSVTGKAFSILIPFPTPVFSVYKNFKVPVVTVFSVVPNLV